VAVLRFAVSALNGNN